MENLHERMNGLIFDVEYSVDAVKSLRTSDEHFNVRINVKMNQSEYFSSIEYCDTFGKIVLYQ